MEDTPELVYFIQAGTNGPIKIGTTHNIARRLSSLQTAHHESLRLLATEPGGAQTERAYLNRFASDALRGEWFRPTPELLALIDEIIRAGTTVPLPRRRRRLRGTGTDKLRNFRVPDEQWGRVKAAAIKDSVTASDVIRDLIDTLPDA